MASLYITEQGTTLRKEQNRLVVERDGTTLVSVHDFKIERVLAFGNVQLTTQSIGYLLERGIDTTFLSQYGKLKGRLTPLESKNVPLRLKQYERVSDTRFALSVAAAMVAGKIVNCREMLARHQRNHAECNFSELNARLTASVEKAQRQTSASSLLGIEGQAASLYFEGFGKMLRRHWRFAKRTRRPPTDPVNAMLSFGYTLMYNEAISALVAVGFDPYLGFFHSVNYGRCSLALDLMEELRPLIADRVVLNLVNLEIVKPGDFTVGEDRGVRMSEEARKRFLREYERVITAEFQHQRTGERTTLRRALHEQSLVLQRTILQGVAYQPFQGWR
jgi:CRISPR-associated protein Cas1